MGIDASVHPGQVQHIVALSGGKDSTAMALRLNEVEPRKYIYVCTPTGNEMRGMKQHWKDLSARLMAPIITPPDVPTLEGLIQIQKCLPNFRMRWCTRMIKIRPFEKFVRAMTPCVVYVGIRADEVEGDREGVDYDAINGVERRFPMDEWGWRIQEVFAYLARVGQSIPERTDCAWCFYQTLYEWYLLWRDERELWLDGEKYEAFTGHTFRSDKRDTQPASMRGLRGKFEMGYIPKDRRKKRKQMCSVCAR